MSTITTAPPDIITQLAQRCMTHVQQRFSFELDTHEDTLGVLDNFIHAVLAEEGGGVAPLPGHSRRRQIADLLAPPVGAYFGEVLRHCFPSRWRLSSDEPRKWALEFDEVPLRFNPVGAAAEAIIEAPIENWGAPLETTPKYSKSLAERLAASPPLPEDQFYILTTRLEVVQIAVDWLHTIHGQDQDGLQLPLDADDYDVLFGDADNN